MLRLRDGPEGEAGAAVLASWPEVTLGERQGVWLPVAVEARDVSHSRALHERVQAVPGVAWVEVVYVGFEGDPSDGGTEAGASDKPRTNR